MWVGLSARARELLERLCTSREPVTVDRLHASADALAELEACMLIDRRGPDRIEVHDVVREMVVSSMAGSRAARGNGAE